MSKTRMKEAAIITPRSMTLWRLRTQMTMMMMVGAPSQPLWPLPGFGGTEPSYCNVLIVMFLFSAKKIDFVLQAMDCSCT